MSLALKSIVSLRGAERLGEERALGDVLGGTGECLVVGKDQSQTGLRKWMRRGAQGGDKTTGAAYSD